MNLGVEIAALREIADCFDHVLLDQWGALHEGKALFPAARDCVLALHAAGKRVLILSNSGKRAADNLSRLDRMGLAPDAYDGVVTSGEVTWQGLRDGTRAPFAGLGRRCLLIARGNDRSVIDGLDLAVVEDADQADFILLAGLDDAAADLEAWRRVLTNAAARNLPMLCANPDLTMFGPGSGLLPAPGALARSYEQLGGRVAYLGKPHRPIFEAALAALGDPAPARVLMIGDSLDHDVLGGRDAGILTLLITAGVHREALAGGTNLRQLAGSEARMPHWVIDRLAW
jgi:HAD superfamily hydrolase (TIGR01459 family)